MEGTKKFKRPQITITPIKAADGTWLRSSIQKANAFADYLQQVFQPHNIEKTPQHENNIQTILDAPYQMSLPIKPITTGEVKTIIHKEINQKKAPGFDLITGRVLREVPEKCIKAMTCIFNAVIRFIRMTQNGA